MGNKLGWALVGVAVLVVGCAGSSTDEASSEGASAVSTPTLHELRCDGTSRVDTSTATIRFTGGNTAHVTVDRDVCTSVWGFPAGCTPQHLSGDFDIRRMRVTGTNVLMVLDNDGSDLDIKVSSDSKTGTWFAHENDYTYELTCDTVDIGTNVQ
jgi:hypothetical protein